MKIFFDTLIALGIFMSAAPAIILLYSMFKRPHSWEARHTKISLSLAIILLSGTSVLVWGSFIEPRIVITKKYGIDLDNINRPITIALISDFQIGSYKKIAWTQRVVEKILRLNPDIVLLAGDHVDNIYYDEDEVNHLKALKQLTAQIPTYAVHGNHEYGIGSKGITDPRFRVADMSSHTQHAMEAFGIRYMVNELEKIKIKDTEIYLFGGDDYWTGKLDFGALESRTQQIPTLVFLHNPSFISGPYPHDVDLYLAGHTHGGQIRLPFIGPIGRVDNFLPTLYYKGMHTLFTGPQLLVTSGAGETGTRARLFNPPEIVLLTIE